MYRSSRQKKVKKKFGKEGRDSDLRCELLRCSLFFLFHVSFQSEAGCVYRPQLPSPHPQTLVLSCAYPPSSLPPHILPTPPRNSFPLIPLHFFKECARRRQRVQSIDPLLRAPSHRPEKKFNSFALSVGTISVPCPLIPLHSPSLSSIGRLSCSSQRSWLFCPLALPIYH